jgi:predicted ArsR family transcriptional regulator
MQTWADRIAGALADGPRTALQLAASLGTTDSAIRVHVARHVDRFGIVGKRGQALLYGLTGKGLEI